MEYCGIDLHAEQSRICILDEDGEVMETSTIRTSRKALERFFSRDAMQVVLEAGGSSPWVSRLLDSLGHEVVEKMPGTPEKVPGTPFRHNAALSIKTTGRRCPRTQSTLLELRTWDGDPHRCGGDLFYQAVVRDCGGTACREPFAFLDRPRAGLTCAAYGVPRLRNTAPLASIHDNYGTADLARSDHILSDPDRHGPG